MSLFHGIIYFRFSPWLISCPQRWWLRFLWLRTLPSGASCLWNIIKNIYCFFHFIPNISNQQNICKLKISCIFLLLVLKFFLMNTIFLPALSLYMWCFLLWEPQRPWWQSVVWSPCNTAKNGVYFSSLWSGKNIINTFLYIFHIFHEVLINL